MPSTETSELSSAWAPQDRWLAKKVDQVDTKDEPFVKVIQQVREFIENNTSIFNLFQAMFNQVPTMHPYNNNPWERPSVRDYLTMLRLFNLTLTEAPVFTSKHADFILPIEAIFSWPMATPAGLALFQTSSVNQHFRNILNKYGKYLSSPASAYVINSEPGGWLSNEALQAMGGLTHEFIHDTSKSHWGFTSWDDFFTRRFQEGARPLPSPHDDHIVTNPCESALYNIAHNILKHDLFWIKKNAYLLVHMLANHKFVLKFIGGAVYQAYLSALTYHRWHAPVTGTIVDIDFVPGTYFSLSPVAEMGPLALLNSQGYITSVATCVNIYIQADNPQIGLMCFMGVGMVEVSSCEVTVRKGERVIQGQEIGMFHFGGSTFCLIFRPEAKIRFKINSKVEEIIKLNVSIGFVDAEGRDEANFQH